MLGGLRAVEKDSCDHCWVGNSDVVLSDEQRLCFDSDGIVKIDGAFGQDEAALMRDVVWGELVRRYAIDRDDPSTWHRHPTTGLKSSKRHRAFAPILGRVLAGALDDLFGVGQWVRPSHAGQVLVTMPNSVQWRVPTGLWHADFQYFFPTEGISAVKIWALFGPVAPQGGGTVQLAGSHRLMVRYLNRRSGDELEYKRVRDGFMRSHPWLRALSHDDGDPGRNPRFMVEGITINGVTLRVLELVGEPGDLFITHPWVMHATAPNATSVPRMMRSVAVYHAKYSATRRNDSEEDIA
jgi:hypothetical protein